MNDDTIRFIDRLFKDLYKSETVLHHSSGNKADKFHNIDEYMSYLEDIHEKAFRTEEKMKTLKRLYFEKYVIKRENIPNSYYKNQERIAFERGLGHLNMDINQRKEIQDEIINNQKKSLEEWLNYFFSEDSKFYPFWAKYWAFQGMLKLGTYDKEKGTFNERTSKTVAPFADLNREALSKSIDLIINFVNKEKIDDTDLESIVRTGSFQKIYPYVLKNVLSDNKNIIKRNEGIWVKYDQGSDHMPLVKSLQGYNTGWCTAGESTAKSQLSTGDFYVYYTLNEKGEYKIPRIAIRMEYGRIGEIRGIGKDQNLESEMEKIVEEKIKEFPDKDKYYKKVNDIKKMTEIYKIVKEGHELNPEELRFLYEIDDTIEGFGYARDPRILELKKGRDISKDCSKIFNCNESQISLDGEDYSSDTICYFGDLDLSDLKTAEGLTLPQYISGNLHLNRLKTAKGLKLPQSISGCLDLDCLETTEGLILPQRIGGGLSLNRLRTAEGLVLPQNMGGHLVLYRLKNAEGLILPQSISGDLCLSSLETAEGLVLPQRIGGTVHLDSLKTIEGIIFPNPLTYNIITSFDIITPYNINEYDNVVLK